MDIKNKIRKTVKTHEFQNAAHLVVGYAAGIVAYTFVCKCYGYRMTRPLGYDANGIAVVQAVSGKHLILKPVTQPTITP